MLSLNRLPFALAAGALTLSVFLVTVTHSQDNPAKSPEAAKAAAGKNDAKKKAEPKGRLPAYYGDVVSGEQREKIYAAQAKYLAEIKKLQQQLDAVIKQRDDEVEALLTPEQKEKVAKLVAEAKAKREATKKKAAPAATATSDAKPDAKAEAKVESKAPTAAPK